MNDLKKTDCFWLSRSVDDWPLVRYFLNKNYDKFNKFYYVVNYYSHQLEDDFKKKYRTSEYYDYPELIKNDLQDYNFEIIYVCNDTNSTRDWRDQCFNEFLKKSNSEYIFHLDGDQYIDPNYIDYLFEMDKFDFNVLCPIWRARLWPFLLTSRYLIDKTTRDFSARARHNIEFNLEMYKRTKNLKVSCKDVGEIRPGDHGDTLMKDLLEITEYDGWKFYQTEHIDNISIHYEGRTSFHDTLYMVSNNICEDVKSIKHQFEEGPKKVHLDYVNKIKETGINLFDIYTKELSYFLENYDNFGKHLLK